MECATRKRDSKGALSKLVLCNSGRDIVSVAATAAYGMRKGILCKGRAHAPGKRWGWRRVLRAARKNVTGLDYARLC